MRKLPEVSSIPKKSQRPPIGVVLWGVFLLAFAAIGLRGVLRTFDARVIPSNPQYVTTDTYLLLSLGVPNASERLVALLDSLPQNKPILFVAPEESKALADSSSSKSRMTCFILSSLAFPRQVFQANADTLECPGLAPGTPLGAIVFYGMQPPRISNNATIKLGALTFLSMEVRK
jgi:hypothetical protein